MYLGIIGPSTAGISIGISLSDPPRLSVNTSLRVLPPPRKIPSNASERTCVTWRRRFVFVRERIDAHKETDTRDRPYPILTAMIARIDKGKFTCPWLAAKRTITKIDRLRCESRFEYLRCREVLSSPGAEMPPQEFAHTYNKTCALHSRTRGNKQNK